MARTFNKILWFATGERTLLFLVALKKRFHQSIGDFNLAAVQTLFTNGGTLSITANDFNLNTTGAINTGAGSMTLLVSDGALSSWESAWVT